MKNFNYKSAQKKVFLQNGEIIIIEELFGTDYGTFGAAKIAAHLKKTL